ncbi:MAG: 2-amino-4-hydroxy-6-hydroxymethyldihydropteridine diphosphokinase [Bacteroidales bacterium]
MHICYLSLGSNMGCREEHLDAARRMLQHQGLVIIAESPVYQTAPWGFHSQIHFLNQVIKGGCSFSASELFQITSQTENDLGRIRTRGGSYENRVIDIDILFFDDMIISTTHLEIPHPRIADRRFILEPLSAIAPYHIHPVLQKDISTLLAACPDHGVVSIFQPDQQ